MRRLLCLVLVVVAACAQGPDTLPPRPDGALRIASYNVHYIILSDAEGRWGVGGWEARKEPMAQAVRALGADIVTFQEMESFRRGSDGGVNLARDWLLEELPEYRAAATGDWREFPPTQPIFYRPDVLEPLDQGWFFFSDTPDQIYSRSFDGSWPAFASWATFRDSRSDEDVTVVNVHTDAFSRINRDGAARLIAERMTPWIEAGQRVVLAGDLNALNWMGPVRQLETAGLTFAGVTGSTYHLDRGLNLFGAIDHVAYANMRQLGAPMVLRRKFDGVWPSDHYPVAVDLAY